MCAEFFCGTSVTNRQKNKPLEKLWRIISLKVFFSINVVKLRRNLKCVQNFSVEHW